MIEYQYNSGETLLHRNPMNRNVNALQEIIPLALQPYFQEYDCSTLDVQRDANLIIQRTLEHGGWEEVRWIFGLYGSKRIQSFLRRHGERCLRPVVFNYWRKLLRMRKWRRSPFPTPKGDLWNL